MTNQYKHIYVFDISKILKHLENISSRTDWLFQKIIIWLKN